MSQRLTMLNGFVWFVCGVLVHPSTKKDKPGFSQFSSRCKKSRSTDASYLGKSGLKQRWKIPKTAHFSATTLVRIKEMAIPENAWKFPLDGMKYHAVQKKTSVVVSLKKHFLILNWKTPINIQHELPFFHDFLKTCRFAFFSVSDFPKNDGPPAAVSSLKFFCLRHRKFLIVNNFFWILRAPKELKSMCFWYHFLLWVVCVLLLLEWWQVSKGKTCTVIERNNMLTF